jgi:hypothetical protein
MFLRSDQLGPRGFSRQYENFDIDGTQLEFRFPAENQHGFKGLSTILAGETMRVKFAVTNTSMHDLGEASESKRKLLVQFYRSSDPEFDIGTHNVELRIENVECDK